MYIGSWIRILDPSPSKTQVVPRRHVSHLQAKYIWEGSSSCSYG